MPTEGRNEASFRDRLAPAIDQATSWDNVVTRLLLVVSEDEKETARPFVYAFGYRLIDANAEERRQIAGAPFGPMIDFGGEQLPPPLADVAPEIEAVWADFLSQTDHPVALSRLHDLLWERGHGERHKHARAAIASYLSLTKGEWDVMTRVACAARALELARAINDENCTAAATAACLEIGEATIAGDDHLPGVALHVFAPLVKLPLALRPERLVEVVRTAREQYQGELPWIRQSLTALLAGLVDPPEADTLWREQVADWRAQGDAATGVLRYEYRQDALQLALSHGFSDLADEIRRDIESMTEDEFDFKTMSAEIDIPAAEVDTLVDWITAAGDWPNALRRLGAQGPPSGQVKANEAAVRNVDQRFPLQSLFGEQIIGPHTSLVFRADTPERKFRLNMARQEGYGVGLFGVVLIRILERLVRDFGQPGEDELTRCLGSSLIDSTLARQCARAFGYYWRAEYDASGHLLAPRIEAIIRRLCLSLGIQVTKLPSGDKPGGVVTLALLLDRLEGQLDESWRRYLCHVLTDALGLNLRNRICHGLIHEVHRVHVALLMHVGLFLAVLDIREDPAPSEPRDARR